jgi:UDP-glucose:(heptosyl)LPS alpha-1,3-glucosyltransferase
MKIGFVRRGFSPSGGAESYLNRLARGITNAGHDVELFTTDEWPIEAWPFGPMRQMRASSPIAFADEIARLPTAADCDLLMSLERIWRCDVYRAGDGVHRAWLERRAKFSGPLRKLLGALNRKHTGIFRLEEALLAERGAGWVLANSRMVKDEIVKFYGYPEEQIDLIYNGVPLEIFSNARNRRSEQRQNLHLTEDEIALLFVGSGWERKGLRQAIDATAACSNSKLRLLVAGRGNAARFKTEHVEFLGEISDVTTLYAAADIFVLPTLYDPFSNACLEALASGLPVITTRDNGFSEIIEDGIHGSVVDHTRDIDALRAAILFWSDAAKRKDALAQILERAAQFDISRNVDQTLRVLLQASSAASVSGKIRKT